MLFRSWGTADALHFTHSTLTGNGSIVARVAAIDAVHAWTKAGVMMRESNAPGAKQAFMLVSPGKGRAFQRRVASGGLSTHTGVAGTAPSWVRIERNGDTFTASVSAFVTAWNPWSQPRSRLTNQARHRRLRTALARMGLPCVAGRGRDPRGRWPAEESFFVMGCSVSEARRLGSVFGQHAVLVGRLGGRPRLLACAAPAI